MDGDDFSKITETITIGISEPTAFATTIYFIPWASKRILSIAQ
jgi:hypothetical protein